MRKTDSEIPLWGGLEGAPHPCTQLALVGHEAQEKALLDAYRMGRLHHAWILGGEEGIGKATLAYRMARFLMVHPDPAAPQVQHATSLSVDPEHPAVRQALHLAHPDIMVLQRAWNSDRKAFYSDIRVDDVRRCIGFFNTTAGAGGWRVCIVDSAEDLRTAGANAFLKVLEEPPPRCLFLIVSSKPRGLLPTIRSRCRLLAVNPLRQHDLVSVLQLLPDLTDDLSLAELERIATLSGGSVRQAVSMLENSALELRSGVEMLLAGLPQLDVQAACRLSEKLAGREAEQAYDLVISAIMDWLHARMRDEAGFSHSDLARWPELWDKSNQAVREAAVFNLDRRPVVLSLLRDLAEAARH